MYLTKILFRVLCASFSCFPPWFSRYQQFDYAVGHWFQKTAENVLGTVLCCPGCFSMYRADAIRDCLKMYSTE